MSDTAHPFRWVIFPAMATAYFAFGVMTLGVRAALIPLVMIVLMEAGRPICPPPARLGAV